MPPTILKPVSPNSTKEKPRIISNKMDKKIKNVLKLLFLRFKFIHPDIVFIID